MEVHQRQRWGLRFESGIFHERQREGNMKQIKILVNGQFQFEIKAAQSESMTNIAGRAADSMRIKPTKVFIGLGVVNLVTTR